MIGTIFIAFYRGFEQHFSFLTVLLGAFLASIVIGAPIAIGAYILYSICSLFNLNLSYWICFLVIDFIFEIITNKKM